MRRATKEQSVAATGLEISLMIFLPALLHGVTHALPERPRAKNETLNFLKEAGYCHLNYIRPAALLHEPPLYAGKVESATTMLIFKTLGITEEQIEKAPNALWTAISVFNHIWRAFDEVVDVKVNNSTDHVTPEMITDTLVFHKFLGRDITAREGIEIANELIVDLIPDGSRDFQKRRQKIFELIYQYRDKVIDTANNKNYSEGDILSFDLAVATKKDVSIFLAKIAASLVATVFDVDDQKAIDLFGQAGLVVQIGDDIVDWEKDWKDHIQQKKLPSNSGKNVRPIENLFITLLNEEPEEKTQCEKHLFDKTHCLKKLIRYAPKTLAKYHRFFDEQIDDLPDHQYAHTLDDILTFMYYNFITKLPLKGPIADWGKY